MLSSESPVRRLIVDPHGGAPALQAWVEARPASVLGRLHRRGRSHVLPARGLEAISAFFMTGDPEAVRRWPPGPIACSHEFPDSSGAVMRADPVHLSPRADRLVMAAARFADLPEPDSAILARDLERALSGGGAGLRRGASGDWYLILDQAPGGRWWAPDEVVGRHILDFMPAGPGCGVLNGLLTEIQMILHEHPVNRRRIEAGLLPVNSIWPWGWRTDESGPPPPVLRTRLIAADPYTLGLQRLAGETSDRSAENAAADELGMLIAGAGEGDEAFFQRMERDWLDPLLRDLVRGRIRGACIVSVEGVGVAVSRLDLIRIWRRGAGPWSRQ